MRTLIEEARNEKGIAVLPYEEYQWLGFFDYMPAWFFKKFGFKGVDRDGRRLLLFFDFGRANPPHLLHPRVKVKEAKGSSELVLLWNSQCPWSGWMADVVRSKTYSHLTLRLINTDISEF